MSGSQRKHEWLQKTLFNHPYLIGLHETFSTKAKEVELYLENILFVVPDLFFEVNGRNIFLELKSGNNQKAFSKGMFQLERMLYWHEFYKKPNSEVYLIMPENDSGRYYYNMLSNLNRYELDDSYRYPSKIYENNKFKNRKDIKTHEFR